jgi:hypothetical protein
MDDGLSAKEAASAGAFGLGVLWAMLKLLWMGQDAKIASQSAKHEALRQRLDDHITLDAAAHEAIRKDLLSALHENDRKSEERVENLSSKMTDQHSKLWDQLIKLTKNDSDV